MATYTDRRTSTAGAFDGELAMSTLMDVHRTVGRLDRSVARLEEGQKRLEERQTKLETKVELLAVRVDSLWSWRTKIGCGVIAVSAIWTLYQAAALAASTPVLAEQVRHDVVVDGVRIAYWTSQDIKPHRVPSRRPRLQQL